MPRSLGSELVSTNATIGGRNAPLGFHQLFLEKTLECRIERAFFNLEQVVGGALDVLDEGVAVEWLALQRAENHHLQGAGEKVSLCGFLHERWRLLRTSVRDFFSQGLEQNSIGKVCCQELFLSKRQNAIVFVPISKFYWNWNSKLVGG